MRPSVFLSVFRPALLVSVGALITALTACDDKSKRDRGRELEDPEFILQESRVNRVRYIFCRFESNPGRSAATMKKQSVLMLGFLKCIHRAGLGRFLYSLFVPYLNRVVHLPFTQIGLSFASTNAKSGSNCRCASESRNADQL